MSRGGERVGDGPRVKFELRRTGPIPRELWAARSALAAAIAEMQRAGCCPTLDDGLAAGNGALWVDDKLLVSRSGRAPDECGPADIVCLERFDPARWAGVYASDDPSQLPTSDAPLYWASLVEAPHRGGALAGSAPPRAALHGHVLETELAAETLGLPISREATMFSTPPDRRALLELMARAPFPSADAWIRRGHGFFVLGASLDDARARVQALASQAAAAGLLPG